MKSLRVMLLAAGLAVSGGLANATPLLPPGVYYGNGNGGNNADWTVTNSNGIELGQDTIQRFVGEVAPVGNVYSVPTGNGAPDGRSWWGFAFSVNTTGSPYNLGNIFPILTMTDVAHGTTGSLDLRLIPDNGHILFPSGTDNDCSNSGSVCGPADTGLQNSETLSFASVAAAFGDVFDVNLNDTYLFNLSAYAGVTCPANSIAALLCQGGLLNSNDMTVITGTGAAAVPEPGTLPLVGIGLAGLFIFGYKRRKDMSGLST